MIEGVALKRLAVNCDDRGYLMEVLRADDPFFRGFGQTTYTVAYPGTIKAFHWHRRQDDLWFVAGGIDWLAGACVARSVAVCSAR